ncbi:hypothetical protein GE21DRAFT_8437 [Neurospora crassa]|uniref:Uncharacterized protein n=1 Tax=Neurospora crassa (strain ATCC 24698 / 74-OR23-1A / CBS 708.71 / DSM 1257 / FGSC 987) TaxID=367110 RepID=Q7RWA2_NEUCR|nr:hypothetical protein NCU07244 [Neurospora crassa OR74A]EAA26668.1 hypothetical protein NCU07244 [Neurospora crassa OR74A]KHE85719.1 hypothetical protein GE21DRAFT_8437 [Neurospora crassa]|eukprot:XP_955904.1 hypothetical protein NCU07244 [Neurospora crassa OR74A]
MSWGPNARNPNNLMPRGARDYDPIGPLHFVCGHLCAVGTQLFTKPGDKDKGEEDMLILPPREYLVEVAWPCSECKDSRAWVWEKGDEVKKGEYVRNEDLMPVVGNSTKAPVVGAGAAPNSNAVASVAQKVEKEKEEAKEKEKEKGNEEKHMQLAKEIERLEEDKTWLEKQLEKLLLLP